MVLKTGVGTFTYSGVTLLYSNTPTISSNDRTAAVYFFTDIQADAVIGLANANGDKFINVYTLD